MSSLIAVPFQVLATTCEVFFILENKLRIQKDNFNVPPLKCDSIMEDVLEKVFAQMKPEEMFKKRKALTSDELRTFFAVVDDHGSLQFEADSFEKIARLDGADDLLHTLSRKMLLLQQLFSNVHTKAEISRKRNAAFLFYQSLSTAELGRVRNSVLNSLRNMSFPVSLFINEGLQLASGHVAPRTTGPNGSNLGVQRVFNVNSGSVEKENKLSLAEAKKAREGYPYDLTAENLFNVDRIAASKRKGEEEGAPDEEYYSLSTDIGDDILFTAGTV